MEGLGLFDVGFVGLSVICILACIFNWNWFFTGKQRWIDQLLGRTMARVFYFFMGLLFLYVYYTLRLE